jgi:hypothetical protein
LLSENIKIKICRTALLPVALYGCETWSVTWRDRVCGNRVQRNILGPKREEVTGDWRRLHSEELHDLYRSPHVVRVNNLRMVSLAGHVASVGARRGAHTGLVGKPQGKRQPGRPTVRADGKIILNNIYALIFMLLGRKREGSGSEPNGRMHPMTSKCCSFLRASNFDLSLGPSVLGTPLSVSNFVNSQPADQLKL